MAENKNSKARIAANNRYNEKAYDRINIAVPKGYKDRIIAITKPRKQTINGFIRELIDKALNEAEQ